MKEKEKKNNTKTKNKKQLHLVLVYPDYLEGDASKRRSGGSYSEGLASISAVIKQGGYKDIYLRAGNSVLRSPYLLIASPATSFIFLCDALAP